MRTIATLAMILLVACAPPAAEPRDEAAPASSIAQSPAGAERSVRDQGSSPSDPASAGEPGAAEAAGVLESYHAAISAKQYERAYRLWDDSGKASGQTFDQFRSGFAQTASVSVAPGDPGRIEGAAGSRYIEIPVDVTARSTASSTQRFRGTYVLRRSVVEGATPEQRSWRIASAKIKRVE